MKRSMLSFLLVFLSIAAGPGLTSSLNAQTSSRPFTIADLLNVRRVADPQLSPDGKWIAYTIADTDKAANRRTNRIYVVSVDGGDSRKLDTGEASVLAHRWSPDGRKLAFIAAKEGVPQIHTIDISNGEIKTITMITTGAGGPVSWSPDGKWLAFVSDVYPDCSTEDCNKEREEEAGRTKVKAKIADRLLYRHWNGWKDGKRSHVLIVSSDGGASKDVTPGDYDAPPFSLGGPDDYAFS